MKRLFLGICIVLIIGGCKTLEETGISQELFNTTIGAASKAIRPISEEEEYYIGRAVAARLLSSYTLSKNRMITDYINLVGNSVAFHSDKPYAYNGYHFAVLNANEVNAFACPGGIIFLTKGMINAVRNEDELAAVLAHEIAHINHRDGISSIQKARWTETLTIIGFAAAREYGSKNLSKLVNLFEGSIDDIVKTLVVNGYGQSQEYDADSAALEYLVRAGYSPGALKDFMERLITKGMESEGGLFKTHPATADRLNEIRDKISFEKLSSSSVQLRAKRFSENMH